MQLFNINSKPVAHMIAQIRAKQLAIRDSQYNIQSIIQKWEEDKSDISGEKISKQIVEGLKKFYDISKSINDDYFKEQEIPATDLGYPIKFNKTDLQLKMAYDYAREQEDNFLGQIQNGKFYNGLSNDVNPEELPILQSDNKISYWGNENSSVSSVLLASIAVIFKAHETPLTGAATFYHYYNSNYTLPEEFTTGNYPFTSKTGMMLFGDYQYGGHRYFTNQLVFGPEDCSSSIGKATYLTTEQVKSLTTTQMRENYSNYGYKLVTILNNLEQKQLESIKPGDIYLRGSHTAIIATKPDNLSNITTLQFSRDIKDTTERKILGGGLYDYNLSTKLTENPNIPIYILRAENLDILHEEVSSQDFLNKLDIGYLEVYSERIAEDIVGDCRIFFEDQEQA